MNSTFIGHLFAAAEKKCLKGRRIKCECIVTPVAHRGISSATRKSNWDRLISFLTRFCFHCGASRHPSIMILSLVTDIIVSTLPPKGDASSDDLKMEELITLVGNALSFVAVLFALVLYGHYTHLHSASNNIFAVVLVFDLLDAAKTFSCIFFIPEEVRYDGAACNACGFVEQWYSFAEPGRHAAVLVAHFSAV